MIKPRFRLVAVATSIFALAASLLACGPTPPPDVPDDTPAPAPAASADEQTAAPAPAAVPERVNGRRVIVTADGSAPQPLGTQRGQAILGIDGDFSLEGVAFPTAIGPYRRGKIIDYGSADSGYSVNYQRPGGVFATVYLYGDGADVRQEMGDVLAAIRHHYGSVSLVTAKTVPLKIHSSTLSAQYARVTFSARGMRLLSDALVVAYRGSYLKMRITGTPDEWKNSDKIVRTLLDGMGMSTREWI